MCEQKEETRMGIMSLFSHLDKFDEPIVVTDPKWEFISEPFVSIDIRQRK